MPIPVKKITPFLNHVAETEPGPCNGIMPHRMRRRLRTQIDDPLFIWNEFCPSGLCLELRCSHRTTITMTGYALDDTAQWISLISQTRQGRTRSDIEMTGLGKLIPDLAHGSFSLKPGTPMTITLDPIDSVDTHFTIMLSHTCIAEIIDFTSDGAVRPACNNGTSKRWTHYGSSISHGAQSPHPADRWVMQVAQGLNLDLTDLSFSGNAQLDQAVARSIAEHAADIITCAVGINIVNADSMRERSFIPALHGFLDTIREQQPQTPIIVITACSCPMQEHTPGPIISQSDGTFRVSKRSIEHDIGALTLSQTRTIIERVVKQRHDPHLTVMHGLSLLSAQDAYVLEDNLHPNQEGINLIASRFTKLLPQTRITLQQ